MAESDLSLLFRFRGDPSGAVKAAAETRAAVNQLRQSFGPQLTQTVTVANKAFSSLSDNLNVFVAQRVPLIGGAFVRISEGLRTLGTESPKTEKAINSVAKSIEKISVQSGKSIPQIATFLKSFIQIEGQADRNKEAVDFFGVSLARKLTPELEKAGVALAKVSTESAGAGSAMAGMAGPIGIVVAALVIEIAAVVALTNALFNLAKQTADTEGKLIDLSQQTGVSVETLNALDIILSKVGGNLDSATQSLIAFQRNLADSQDESSKSAKAFQRLGVDTSDTETALRATLKALAAMPEGFRQTDLAAQLFGARGGKQFLAALKETNGDIDKAVESIGDLARITTEQAKLSDEFNDKLRDLQLLLRGITLLLGREVIPFALSALRDTEDLIKKNEEAFQALAIVVKLVASLVATPLKAGLIAANETLKQMKPALLVIVELYERLAAAVQLVTNRIPNVDPNAIPKQSTAQIDKIDLKREDIAGAGIFRKQEDLDRLKAALANELEALQDSIEDREQAFQAESEDLRRELEKRQIEFKKYIETSKAKNQERLQKTLADLETERTAVKRALDQRAIDENEHAKRIRQIDNQVRDARRAAAKEQQRLDDEVAAHERKQLEATTEVLRATIDAQLRIAEIGDQQREASIRALAAMRVKSEEDAEREILKIKLDAIDREKARLETEVKATGSIQDPEEQLKVRARLNLELRVLAAERTTIEQDGERDVEAARQRDLANERRFADELQAIAERIRDIERDTAREVIRLMVLNFASRKDIIRAQLKEDLKEEDERHRRETEIINQEKQETEERIKTLEGYLKNLKVGTAAEIEQYNRLVEALEKLRIKRDELDAQKDAEDRRHKTRTEAETEDAQRKIDLAGPGGGILEGLTTGQLADMQKGIDTFSNTARVALSAVGVAFNQLGQAAGEAVKAFVLFGTAGGSFRKFAAEVLASLAQMAIVKAIFEAAEGLAMLALTYFTGNPKYAASAGFHFASAAAYGAIGGVAALAGRSVAGDIFKPKGATGGGGADSSQGGPQQINPLTLGRNQPQAPNQLQPQIIEHRHTLSIRVDDSEFGKAVSAHLGKEWRNGGKIRELVLNDADI